MLPRRYSANVTDPSTPCACCHPCATLRSRTSTERWLVRASLTNIRGHRHSITIAPALALTLALRATADVPTHHPLRGRKRNSLPHLRPQSRIRRRWRSLPPQVTLRGTPNPVATPHFRPVLDPASSRKVLRRGVATGLGVCCHWTPSRPSSRSRAQHQEDSCR
jgi:hypothetical protein